MTFKSLAKESSGLIFAAVLLSLLGACATLAQPSLVGRLVESIGSDSAIQPTLVLILLILVAAVLSGVQMYVTSLAADRSILYIRKRLTHHLLRLPLRVYDKEGSGSFVTRLTSDTSVVSSAFSSALVESVGGLVVVIGVIGYMAYIDIVLFGVVVLILLISLLVIVGVSTRVSSLAMEVQDNLANVGSLLQTSISAIRTVKSSTAENLITSELNKRIAIAFRAGKKMGKVESILSPVSTVTVYISLVAVLIFGAVRVDSGAITGSELIVFITSLFLIVSPISQVADAISSFREASGAFERIRKVLDTPLEADLVESEESSARISASKRSGLTVCFNSVCFGYEDNRVLDSVSFSVAAGEKVAVVGPSGSGKTTLLSLALRFYEPNGGSVLIGGEDVSEWDLRHLRRDVSYIEQEPMLLPGTLRDNLTLGLDREVRDSELIDLLDDVGLSSFASSEGLEKVIASSGSGVSGGERQRLAIARAIIRNASLIIVDEPTSALDAKSGSKAVDHLLSTSASVLFCTHDSSMAARADRVITLSDGIVVESHQTSGKETIVE
ncbi:MULTISPECIES: ABC transporter ATP-binding protein [Corynebacterium]|uniref:ABC transporter ATP-binding protein n=1 Tax=Corynebacterium TaxID=1716 RepID=UPI00124E3FD2|nr:MULTISPECIES: ABC transporter ATP-binding protein [Corynebacterium]